MKILILLISLFTLMGVELTRADSHENLEQIVIKYSSQQDFMEYKNQTEELARPGSWDIK